MFTGQGAQYARMGAELIEQSPLAHRIVEDLETMLYELGVDERPSWSLRAEILATASSSRVHQAAISQPLCTAVQVMMVDLLREAKVDFCAVIGHSSGEIAAAYAAGFLTAREAIYIAYYRGFHLDSAASPNGKGLLGGMLAVGMSMENASGICARDRFAGRVSVAASNSSASVTISGDEDAIAELQVVLDAGETFNRRLKVDKAYHSAHMKPCGSAYVRSLEACVRKRQVQETGYSCTWYSSVYNEAIDPAIGVPYDYWAENMARPVLFSQALTSATTEVDFGIAIEVGAHPALKGPASQTIEEVLLSKKTVPYFGMLSRGTSAVDAFSTTLGRLWCTLGPQHMNLDDCEKAMCEGPAFIPVGTRHQLLARSTSLTPSAAKKQASSPITGTYDSGQHPPSSKLAPSVTYQRDGMALWPRHPRTSGLPCRGIHMRGTRSLASSRR